MVLSFILTLLLCPQTKAKTAPASKRSGYWIIPCGGRQTYCPPDLLCEINRILPGGAKTDIDIGEEEKRPRRLSGRQPRILSPD